jgi:hypothetical protein
MILPEHQFRYLSDKNSTEVYFKKKKKCSRKLSAAFFYLSIDYLKTTIHHIDVHRLSNFVTTQWINFFSTPYSCRTH